MIEPKSIWGCKTWKKIRLRKWSKMFYNVRWWGLILRKLRTLALPARLTAGKDSVDFALRGGTHRFLFQLPYHSAVFAFLRLCFSLPFTLTLPLFIYFSFPVASTQSCFSLCHDWGLSPLPRWFLRFLLLPAECFTFWVPGKTCAQMLRSHTSSKWWGLTGFSGLVTHRGCWLSLLAYWGKLLGQGWSLGPEPTVIHAYEWILWLSERMMHCLHMEKMFGRDSPGEGRESSVVKW